MAINRVKSPYASGYFGPLYGPAAFAIDGGDISTFVATSSNPNNVVGATYKVHRFDNVGSHSITFSKAGYVDLLIIAGGGTGGNSYNNYQGGGGGAGGLIQVYGYGVTASTYSVVVGAGGVKRYTTYINDQNGDNSSFGSLIAYGGGYGGGYSPADSPPGGSTGGTRDTGSVGTPVFGQGNSGAQSAGNDYRAGGGGGGAGAAAVVASVFRSGGNGGDGLAIAFDSNESLYYAGGGGGAGDTLPQSYGGLGGGGRGSYTNGTDGENASFYGGGGGGARYTSTTYFSGGAGYQGIVMVRYRIS